MSDDHFADALRRAADRTDTGTEAGRAVATWLRELARGEGASGVIGIDRPVKTSVREVTAGPRPPLVESDPGLSGA